MTDPSNPVVVTAQGQVRGFWRDRSAAFLGIPFAEAPVGARRFAAPVPHPGWSGVRDATRYGPTPQRRPFAEVTSIPEPSIPGEETLSVNVFTPAPGDRDAALPVLVWIHGGGFKAGSAASPWYDGFAFNRDGVVTVSISYRLGFDGFGWIADAPHNRGLLDQIEALRWVQANIAAFGGDPGRVTIAGQSAGGGSVLGLVVSPAATGLFRGAISQSGVLEPVDLAAARRLGERLAELAGVPCTRDGLAKLTEDQLLDLQELVEREGVATPAGLDQALDGILGHGGLDGLAFGPHLDESVLPAPPEALVAAGAGAGVPLLIGATAHEFTAAGAAYAPLLPGQDLTAALERRLGSLTGDYLAAYADLPGGPEKALGQLVSDVTFRVPLVRWAGLRGASPTWVYDVRFRPNGTGLAQHCLDLPFVFDHLDAERVTASTGHNPPHALAEAMHGAWVAFVTGGSAPWPPWDERRIAMIFDTASAPAPAYGLETALAARLARGTASMEGNS